MARALVNETGKVLVVVQQGDQPHGSRPQNSCAERCQPIGATGWCRPFADLVPGPRSVAGQLGVRAARYSARSAAGGIPYAVPAHPAEPAAIAPDLAPTPRQHLDA